MDCFTTVTGDELYDVAGGDFWNVLHQLLLALTQPGPWL